MKKIIIALIFVSAGVTSFATGATEFGRAEGEAFRVHGDLDEGIDFFEGTWAQALKASDKENKLIFMDAYAAWCGPCKLMAKNTFTDERVGEFFNKNFINVKMDMEKNTDGPRLSKKYGLTHYPSLYFVDKNEEKVHFTMGYLQPKELIAAGQQALKQ